MKTNKYDANMVVPREEPKAKYTEEDMRQAFEYGKTLEPFDCFEDFINSLNKQD